VVSDINCRFIGNKLRTFLMFKIGIVMKPSIIGICLVIFTALSVTSPRLVDAAAGTEILAEIRSTDTNQPVVGVTVTLTGKLKATTYEACVTDENGKVSMRVRNPGTYTVRVTSDEYERAEVDLTVVAGDKLRTVQMLLTPKTAADRS
jgi:hypothetical protein